MPLRDVSEYHSWIEREAPSTAARHVAHDFIVQLGDRPWQAPSVPIAELSDQPTYEIRTAKLSVEGESPAQVWYLHLYATGAVDLIAVTNR